MDFEEIKSSIIKYQEDGRKLFTTSSFQTHSIVLLHLLSRIDKSIPVYCLNTGFLFPETIEYKDQLADAFGITIKDIKPDVPKSIQKDAEGKLLFASDPDRCCYYNKVQPMDKLLSDYDIWINGIRRDQNANRAKMRVEEPSKMNTVRFHPMLEWTNKMIFDYIKEHDLPRHPLDAVGYSSIGCEPCTRKPSLEMMEREARWYGMNKTECGLHTELVSK
ncbi:MULTISPECIES: phosphoadenylyl-sulfate reductase [Reichenbachiella]|uniref:phosphoadenylyl-sulfate reductase n=1 Tax=Reichenbachiella TaxID=156993 RepID=UPI000C1543A8|nr:MULTISPECIES: phosphoadenylyl-sulfate reductase [Reichenbachiella]MBU2915517.1 phosphoadenylyl-sulfate reductase [Reichenbachiella agariperforans]PIB36847.1 phosphoadenosine phosphosulfate reductase [Reichenbachiella sp. 5M10]RJE71418.1 phosphoadenosine phosphosulfate reductase [Reichenbachiella sp. MSK19-1]